MKVKFKKLHPNAVLPKIATIGAGAMDVTCTEIVQENGFVRCMVGFSTEIPTGYRIICAARSSITKTGWILSNGIGIVDSDYRGEWEFRFSPLPDKVFYGNSLGNKPFPYNVGDRVGQIFLEKIIDLEFEEVTELEESDRTGGFGSTGNS
jgi:dUTP pyrophosphatase